MASAVGWRTAVLAVAVALVPACRSTSRAEGPTATLGTAPPITTTTTTNPYAVPAVIDAAYVNRVLAGLDAAIGEVSRLVVRTSTIPPEAIERLRALYADPEYLQIRIDGLQTDMRNGFSNYKPKPGNQASAVTQLITSKPNCVFAKVQRDYSAVGLNPSADLSIQWIGLKPLDATRDPKQYNPTPWAYVYDGFPPNHNQPPDPCAS